MLSKRKLKFFKSLQTKKSRLLTGNFLVEGAKGIIEALKSDFTIDHLLLTQEFYHELTEKGLHLRGEVEMLKEQELKSAGTFKTNNAGLAVLKMPSESSPPIASSGITLLLEDVRDPGNLGTIIRIADWYGIKHIVCSEETADVYNPKVINSTMGSFTRVKVYYTDLHEYLSTKALPLYGAVLNGVSLYDIKLPSDALLIMGNESKGISADLLNRVDEPVKIPSQGGAESLNVAIATAVVLDNFFR